MGAFMYVFMAAIVGYILIAIGNATDMPAFKMAGNIVLFVGGLIGICQGAYTLSYLSNL